VLHEKHCDPRRKILVRILALTALAALFTLAAPCALAVDQAVAPHAGDDVPSASTPLTPEAQSLAREAGSDGAITALVASGILADPRLAGSDVSVNTNHGVVNLTGTVRTREQAVDAIESAQRPDGVMRVDNHLSVTPE
jgi:hyperosmotically inducible protein